MQALTPNQVMAALNLSKSRLISSVSVEVDHNGLTRITVNSAIGAEWDRGVDTLIAHSLDKEFPTLEYHGKPVTYHDPFEDTENELYFLDYNGETLINLVMKKAPAPTEATSSIQQFNSITDSKRTEPLMTDREKYLEYHETIDDLGGLY